MKIGLDYHGVVTANPEFFSKLTKALCSREGTEVHIITGRRITPAFKTRLEQLGIRYTHLYSIADHHRELGTPMIGYDEDLPEMDSVLWDKTKAAYCSRHGIDLHFDDSDEYVKYFSTPYAQYIAPKEGRDRPKVNALLTRNYSTCCPDCTTRIPLGANPKEGAVLICGSCGYEFEIGFVENSSHGGECCSEGNCGESGCCEGHS